MQNGPTWQPLLADDLPSVVRIAAEIHAGLPEREEVLAEKIRLFPSGCRKLVREGEIIGYGLSHPWRLNTVPPLDDFLGQLPGVPGCLYIHDIAILPAGRGRGAATVFMEAAREQARAVGIPRLALVSVYGTSTLWKRAGFSIVRNEALETKLKTYGPTACYMTRSVDPSAA